MDIQKQNEQREIIQSEAERLSIIHKHLLITWATGCGKSVAVLKGISASRSPKQWLIVVPEILQIENFKRDIVKHGFEYLLEHQIKDIICYASFKNYKGQPFNLCLNECHRLSQEREKITETIDFDQIISDSATVPSSVKERLNNIHPFHEYHISLKEAIEKGILPEPAVYLVPVTLNDKERCIPVKYGKKVINKTQKEYADKFDSDIAYWQEKYEKEQWPDWIKMKIVQLGLMRKKFLADCKTNILKQLIEIIEGQRFICFTGSVDQCNLVGGKNAINSKKTKKHNIETIEKFNNFEIDQIYVNKMGREGLNMNEINSGIITQLDSGNDEGTSFLQMFGRSLRALSPNIYILYCKDTHDERLFLKRALKLVDEKYIKTLEI